MSGRIVSAKYTMVADFYRQVTVRNNSGQITRRWDREDPYIIQNRSESILVQGFTTVASTEKWSKDYEPVEYVRMYIKTPSVDDDEKGPVVINKSFRVSNIRDRITGDILWLNEERDPIEFLVLGVNPVQDPFGRNIEYELLLKGVVDK